MTADENVPIDDIHGHDEDVDGGVEGMGDGSDGSDGSDDADDADDAAVATDDGPEAETGPGVDGVEPTDGTFGGRYTDRPERPMWQIIAGVVAVIAVVGIGTYLAFSVFDGTDESPGDGQPALAASVDEFDRPDSPDVLGATEDGLPWTDVSGEWGIRNGQAVVTTPNPDGPRSLATFQTAGANGTITVKAGTLTQGWGITFRYQGQFNYWYLTAQPDFATYNLGRVVNGENENLGGVGLAGIDDGVEVVISLEGAGIEIIVDGKLARALTDSTLSDATGVGLLALGGVQTEASWESITADMVPNLTPQFTDPTPSTTTPGATSAPATTVPSTPAG